MSYQVDTDGNGTRYATGSGGGRLVFRPDGKVNVSWVWTAALAADHGAGKRSKEACFTTPCKGQPPAESEAVRTVMDVRNDARAFVINEDWREADSREFASIHRPLAWRLLRAVATGDAATLRQLANAVEMAHSITTDAPLNASPWAEIAEAIRTAAQAKNDVPTRSEVVDSFNRAAAVNHQLSDMRERLERMGFGWLPAPQGRPAKKPR